MRVLDSDFGPLIVDDDARLGQGGRGSVFPVLSDVRIEGSDPGPLVCKLVSEGYRSPGRRRKIECLARMGQQAGVSAAWPLGNVLDESGEWAGYLMRRVDGVTLDAVCADDGISLRDRALLAAKACGIVARMHELGIVIGDVNMANFMYDLRPDVLSLIDLDSVQVIDHDMKEVYPVVESLEKSPDMLEQGLGKAALTCASDNFLLAVMVFRMLFGAHPLDSFEAGATPSEVRAQNALERRFPYRNLVGALPVETYGSRLATLFERSFTGPAREVPSAIEYRDALESLVANEFDECASRGACEGKGEGAMGGKNGGHATWRFAAFAALCATVFLTGLGVDVFDLVAEVFEGIAQVPAELAELVGGAVEAVDDAVPKVASGIAKAVVDALS